MGRNDQKSIPTSYDFWPSKKLGGSSMLYGTPCLQSLQSVGFASIRL